MTDRTPNRAPGGGQAPLPPIDFAALAQALLVQADHLVADWLPGGVRRGHEWVCGSLAGERGSSCCVNLATGSWADFAGDEKGGDLISLYAAIHALGMGQAAVQLARMLGLESVANVQTAPPGAGGSAPPPPPPRPAPAPSAKQPEDEGWQTLMPVPANAPQPTFRHYHRRAEDIAHTACYRQGGHVLGYVVRFRTSDGGKDTLPYTWCQSARDGGQKWVWKQWDQPRPLYLPGGVLPNADARAGKTIVIVEGEVKAEVLQACLESAAPGVYVVVSWPGGSKAWQKALWVWLAGCTVLLWPDCDAKREPLTKAERESTIVKGAGGQPDVVDDAARLVLQQAKPLLPEHKQPGMSAMLGIGHLLAGEHGCSVQMLPIPKPGEVADGWDARDAIEIDGWDAARVLEFFGRAQPLQAPPPDDAGKPSPNGQNGPTGASGGVGGHSGGGGRGGKNGAASAGAEEGGGGDGGAGDGDDEFADHLDWLCDTIKCKRHQLSVNRALVITALRLAPALADCLGFDELRNAPCTRMPWPWRAQAGPLRDQDDLRLGEWLTHTYRLRSASRAALAEAIDTVADSRPFHPIRDWLVEQAWDGTPRREKWLIHVLGMDPATLSPRRRRYLELVGRYVLAGHVARVMEPGCKFDYSVVLEGVTGMGKSTLVKELVGREFFSDTHFDIGSGNAGMEQLEGLWAYELGELTAFRRADSEQIKQFFSSTIDRFRGAYGRFVQPHPRQCVIWCTTNKRQYLYDLTGNRRFWPIWVGQRIRLDWLRKWRGQLFAEALAAYQAGEAIAPTEEEEEAYFKPEQRLRVVETAVQSRLFELLTRPGSAATETRTTQDLNEHTLFVTIAGLVAALGSDAAKSTAILESQVRASLEAWGWVLGRESTGQPRRRGYRRPDIWPPAPDVEDDDHPGGGGPPASPAGSQADGGSASTDPVSPARAWLDQQEGSDDAPF